MKKNKIIEVCIWVVVLIALINGMFYFTNGRHWISYKKPVANREITGLQEMKREKADTSKIGQIELRLRDADVAINCVEGNEIEVIEYAKDNDEEDLFKMTQKGSTLKFERKNREQFGGFFGDNRVQHYIEVKLPKDFNKCLVIENSSGDVALVDSFVLDELELGTTSGNITLKEIQGDLELGTSSGDIFIESVEGEEHEIGCTSGKVTIEEGKGDFEIETTSGDVFLKKVSGSKHEITTTSGDIDIKEGKGEFDTETNSGDIRKGNISE